MERMIRTATFEASAEREPAGDISSPREVERDALYVRLEQGYERIEQGLTEGRDMGVWEDFWIALLREYERICDDLREDLAA